jgi:selT/selW/selH-like putative selenoprotein
MINDAFPSINVSLSNDAGKTGNFEVTVNGSKVHSRQMGQGFVDSEKKQKAMMAALRKALHGG